MPHGARAEVGGGPVEDAVGPGASTYSVGVWTRTFRGTEAFGLPLRPDTPLAVSALADAVPNVLGVLHLIDGVWVPHLPAMPAGVYDAAVVPGGGYQVSVSGTASRYAFVGR